MSEIFHSLVLNKRSVLLLQSSLSLSLSGVERLEILQVRRCDAASIGISVSFQGREVVDRGQVRLEAVPAVRISLRSSRNFREKCRGEASGS